MITPRRVPVASNWIGDKKLDTHKGTTLHATISHLPPLYIKQTTSSPLCLFVRGGSSPSGKPPHTLPQTPSVGMTRLSLNTGPDRRTPPSSRVSCEGPVRSGDYCFRGTRTISTSAFAIGAAAEKTRDSRLTAITPTPRHHPDHRLKHAPVISTLLSSTPDKIKTQPFGSLQSPRSNFGY